MIYQTTPDGHPPTPPSCRWPSLITLPTLAKFQLVWRRLCDVVLFRSSCLFEHTLTAVCALPKYQSVLNVMCMQTFCDHLHVVYIFNQTDLYRFEVRLELYGANARLVISPASFSPSHSLTPPPSRWPALTTLPPLAKFQLVWRRLCEALLSSSSLAGQKHRLCCLVCLKCRRYKRSFAMNMNKSSIVFADTVDALTATFAV